MIMNVLVNESWFIEFNYILNYVAYIYYMYVYFHTNQSIVRSDPLLFID